MIVAAVFVMLLVLADLSVALVTALATIIAGGIVTITSASAGATWSAQLRDRAARLRHLAALTQTAPSDHAHHAAAIMAD